MQAIRILRKLSQAIAWLLTLVIVILSLGPPSTRPVTGIGHNFEHLLIFLATGAAFAFGYPRQLRVLPVGLVAFAVVVELTQLVVPGRHARLSDFLTDATASLLGVCISYAAIKILARYEQKFTARND